jgi:hypothetical protein
MQILANRLCLLMYNPGRERQLRVGLLVAIGIINVSVFVIWIPTRLHASETFARINSVWDRIEKVIFALIDMSLNGYFMWLVRTQLVANGLRQYALVYKYNLAMACFSVSLDVRCRRQLSQD